MTLHWPFQLGYFDSSCAFAIEIVIDRASASAVADSADRQRMLSSRGVVNCRCYRSRNTHESQPRAPMHGVTICGDRLTGGLRRIVSIKAITLASWAGEKG